jgi:DNA-binding CsgD family transcriptional regulator
MANVTADVFVRNIALSARQEEVLLLVTIGLQNKEIAVRLGISPRTVKWHIKRLCEIWDVSNRTALAGRASSITSGGPLAFLGPGHVDDTNKEYADDGGARRSERRQ